MQGLQNLISKYLAKKRAWSLELVGLVGNRLFVCFAILRTAALHRVGLVRVCGDMARR
jgi:hypothetical protein